MTQFFEFGTIWFWVLILVSSALIILSTENDEGNYTANIWFMATLLLLYFMGNSEFFRNLGLFVLHNPVSTLLFFASYLVTGTAWSIVKWFFYLKKIRRFYSTPPNYFNIDNYRVSNNKERITHWMIYWPFSALWTVINDPVKKAFEFILFQFGGLYDKMAEKILGDLKNQEK